MAIWARLGLMLIGAAFVAALAGCNSYLPQGSTAPEKMTPALITEKINAVRKAYGRKPVTRDAALVAAAQRQADLMAQKDTLSHDLGETLRERVTAAGYTGAVGEDVAGGQSTLEAALTGWLKSAPHQKTLLNPKFTDYGLGVARVPEGTHSRYGVYWSLIMGGRAILWLQGY